MHFLTLKFFNTIIFLTHFFENLFLFKFLLDPELIIVFGLGFGLGIVKALLLGAAKEKEQGWIKLGLGNSGFPTFV